MGVGQRNDIPAAGAPLGKQGIEVVYTTVEALTADGRDRSIDYKVMEDPQ